MPTRQSGFYLQRNQDGSFEAVFPSTIGGFVHRTRRKDAGGAWEKPVFFGSGFLSNAALMQSPPNGEAPGYLEIVARNGDALVYYCREDDPPFRWFGPFIVRLGVFGAPAMIETADRNFEVIVPLVTGGMAHITRDNSLPEKPWNTVAEFSAAGGLVDGVALIQSSFGAGNLEMVANIVSAEGNRLAHYWRDVAPGSAWNGPGFALPGNVEPAHGSSPALIQSSFGSIGNFELVVAVQGGGLAHFRRNNDDPALAWSEPVFFGSGEVSAVGLFQGDIGQPGNLEVAAKVGSEIHLYFFDGQTWTGPSIVESADLLSDSPTQGQWTIPYSSGVVGIHMALLHTGKVLFFSYHGNAHAHGGGTHHDELDIGGEGVSAVLDPATGKLTRPLIEKNLFCAGQAIMPDGRLLVAGGGGGGSIDSFHAFTPEGDAGTWKDMGLMTDKRWYPTVTAMTDGRMFVISGTRITGGPETGDNLNDTYEIFDPLTNTHSQLVPAPFLNEATPFALFPFCYQLPDGRMMVHAGKVTRFLDVSTGEVEATALPCLRSDARTYRFQGTSVLLPLMPDSDPPYRARIMVIGGGTDPGFPETPATETCEILDLGDAAPAWKAVAPMHFGRLMCDSVLLPDGTVLVTNGSAAGQADLGDQPVFPAEIYDPATNTWNQMGSTRVPRLYHSTGLLLPDGRVLTAGKDEDFNPEPFKYPELRLEVFSPPYLFRGPRPEVTAGPASVAHGATFTVSASQPIASACLMRPGAVTHSFNMSQRYIGLRINGQEDGQIQLEAPPLNAAPPGFYMLFILNEDGVPSVALWLKLG